MFIDEIVLRLFSPEKEHIIVTDMNGELVWKSKSFPYSFDEIMENINSGHDDSDEWEFLDVKQEVNLKVRRVKVDIDGKSYVCCHFTDFTEYSMLMKDALAYTKNIADISVFQTKIMELMSESYDAFMPVFADYCDAEELVMYAGNDGYITKSVFNGTLTRSQLECTKETESVFSCKRNEKNGGYHCLVSSETENRRYCVFAKITPSLRLDNFLDVSAYNVLKLFIENSILREKIVYESEHDRLTGLYNMRKYMAMKADNFGDPRSVAVYNLDVNNLKYINDNFGHEYGDKLIVKAAKSIKAVVSDNVFGFRMGGDEFIILAVNITEKEARDICVRWEKALETLNSEDNVYCVMACGLQYGEDPLEYDELYSKADALMYLDKKTKKENSQTSHIK